MAKTNFSNYQTIYNSPYTHPLEDLGVLLMHGCFRATRRVTLKPLEYGPLVGTAAKVQSIKLDETVNWIAKLEKSSSPWKMGVVKCVLAIASIPFIPFTLLGAAFITLFRNSGRTNERTWEAHLKKEEKEKLPKLKELLEQTSTKLRAITNGNIDGVCLKTFQDYRTLITQATQILSSVVDPSQEKDEVQDQLRFLEIDISSAVTTYTVINYPPVPARQVK